MMWGLKSLYSDKKHEDKTRWNTTLQVMRICTTLNDEDAIGVVNGVKLERKLLLKGWIGNNLKRCIFESQSECGSGLHGQQQQQQQQQQQHKSTPVLVWLSLA